MIKASAHDPSLADRRRHHLEKAKRLIADHAQVALREANGDIMAAARNLGKRAATDAEFGKELEAFEKIALAEAEDFNAAWETLINPSERS